MRKPASIAARAAVSIRRRIRASEAWFLLLSLLVGVFAGLVAVAIGQFARGVQRILYQLPLGEHLSAASHVPALSLLALPVGGAAIGLAAWLMRRRTPVDVVEANALYGGRIPARDTANVVGFTVASNGVGASVGLEAAYAQAGGGIASLVGQRLKLRRADLRTLVGAGTGAAISAAFGAPLTGAFYAFEIVLGAYTPATIAPVMAASIAAAVTTRSMGITPYVIAAGGMHPIGTADYALYGVLGLVCALTGIFFMRMVALVEHGVRRLALPVYAAPVIGGLLMIPLALLSPPSLSSGHGALNLYLVTTVTLELLALTIVVKMIASAVSIGFGFRGGLFFASLFLGSLIGRLFQVTLAGVPHLHILAPDDSALVGMAAFAVAIVGGPMTIGLLVLEVTHDFGITGVAIAAALISSSVVRELFGYSFSTWRFHLRGETIRSGRDIGWMRLLTAGRMMRRDVPVAHDGTALAAFRTRFPLGSVTRVVLTDAEGRYAGIVPVAAAHAADEAEAAAASLATLTEASLREDMHIGEIMEAFDRNEADDLAVLSPDGSVSGMLTEKYVRRRYAEELEKAQRELYGD